MSNFMALLSVFIGGFICGYCYKSRELDKKEPYIVQLKDLCFFENWFFDCGSQLFSWWGDYKDCRYGNYNFRYAEFKVTGRKASKYQLKDSVEQYAYLNNYQAKFFVLIEKRDDHELVRIVYVVPELECEYQEYLKRKSTLKKEAEIEKEKKKRIYDEVGLKS